LEPRILLEDPEKSYHAPHRVSENDIFDNRLIFGDNWRQKSAARSTLKMAIEDTLDTLPEAYDRTLFAQKCSAVFEHVYESYPERNEGVYAVVG
jgi:hypothetical protein